MLIVYELTLTMVYFVQMAKRKEKEEMDKKLLEKRAIYIEKAKTVNIDAIQDDKPRKSGSKVTMTIMFLCLFFFGILIFIAIRSIRSEPISDSHRD